MSADRYEIGSERVHSKAREVYLECTFYFDDVPHRWDIPIEYPRTGTHLRNASDTELGDYFDSLLSQLHPRNWAAFRKESEEFWATRNAEITQSFFDCLVADFKYKSRDSDLPSNPNFARRIQDLKTLGFTLATDPNRIDEKTGTKTTHICLIPIPRGGITGYEAWSPALRRRIVKVLNRRDAYEGIAANPESLLPDHKFPEVRWDLETKRDSLENMADAEIVRDFQLITNQRNQQKREVCRKCAHEGIRGTLFGIDFYYEGARSWPEGVPTRGKHAEKGCIGCGWYDMDAWRSALNHQLGIARTQPKSNS